MGDSLGDINGRSERHNLVSDNSLLAKVATDDRDAFRQLYDRHGRAVYLYTSSIVGRGEAALDASQEAWMTLWTSRRRVQLATDSALPWLLVTARHKALHILNDRHGKTVTLDVVDERAAPHEAGPAAIAEGRDLDLFISTLVGSMPETDRILFARCIRDGESYESVSRDLDLGSAAVKHRISRIRRRMRTAIHSREES